MEINANGHAYVDLGLPSGTLWAKRNVGANKETDAGLYFAWGETTGYTEGQVGAYKRFTWGDYKHGNAKPFTKYDQDGKTILEPADDAATVNMGGDWRMPTKKQCIELLKKTKNGFVTNEGAFTQYAWSKTSGLSEPTSKTTAISNWSAAGYLFFKKSYASVIEAISANDYLFIPFVGYCGNGEVHNAEECGVWSSSLDMDCACFAWNFYFDGYEASVDEYGERLYGQSVRGVISK